MALPACPDELVAEIFDRCDGNTKALALRRLSKAHRQRYRGCVVVRGPEPPSPQLFERWVKTADSLSFGELLVACDTVVARYPRWMLQMMVECSSGERVRRRVLCAAAEAGQLEDVIAGTKLFGTALQQT